MEKSPCEKVKKRLEQQSQVSSQGKGLISSPQVDPLIRLPLPFSSALVSKEAIMIVTPLTWGERSVGGF
jgi:hypothetical protein